MYCSYLEFCLIITLTIFISTIVYFIANYKENLIDIRFFFKKTIFYYVYKNAKKYKNKYYTRIVFYVIILTYLLFSLYCSNHKFLQLLIEITYLFILYLIFDVILNILLIPLLKKVLINIKFNTIILNKKNLFDTEYIQNLQNNSILFIYPLEDRQQNISLIGFRHLLWMMQLYNRKYLVFYYTLLIVLIEAFFFMLIDIFFLNMKHDIIFFIYATIWMIFVTIKIKELTGFTFFEKYFSTKIYNPRERFILKHLSIKKYFNNNIINYTIEEIDNEIRRIKKISKQNIDYFTVFISTVLYIGILTYAGWN